jgi:hypothetical protein
MEGVLLGSVLSEVRSESCRPRYMACVAESIGCFVVDICIVADLKDFSHDVTSDTASQSSGIISNRRRSRVMATKLSMIRQ